MSNNIGKIVIIRGDRSGVFFGKLESKDGREVTLSDCRRLWYWDGANSISDIANKGVSKPNQCKFTAKVKEIVLLDVIEIIRCEGEAIKNIEEVPEWTY